ncbi:phosphotransferase [Calothrix sp. 336/3]|uniref:phosphotransferase n=1 Tax=Calothrix sp. 336/3 TaxID=1337936 RepID=UPI0009E3670A
MPAKSSQLEFFLASIIDAVRINVVTRQETAGKVIWHKQRRPWMDGIIWCGNIFLRLSRSRIIMFPNCCQWVEWEMHCCQLLYTEVQTQVVGDRGFWVEALPGQSLLQHHNQGTLTLPMFQAAAREFRRAHSIYCPQLADYWSHGDPHLANVLYDTESQRACLIDFETQHEAHLSSCDRHADDLLVFILDTIGRTSATDWLAYCQEFLQTYGNRAVIDSLKDRLELPDGWERVLWATRTNYLPSPELKSRLQLLKASIR